MNSDRPDVRLHIEASWTAAGELLSFILLPDQDRAASAFKSPADYIDRAHITRGLAFLALFVIAAPLALRNLQRGRSDSRGALRLALFVLALRVAVWLLATHHVPDFRMMFGSLLAAIAGSITYAAVVWVYYVALEPFVRKFWPHSLISWARLLGGQLRDPLVGGHLLIGVAVGASWAILVHLDQLVPQWLGWPVRVLPRIEDILLSASGVRAALAGVIYNVTDAIDMAMLLLLLVVLFRALLRRLVPALAVTVVVFAAVYFPLEGHSIASIALLGAMIALGVWMLMQFGLVCVIATVFACSMLIRVPLTLDPRLWYADLSLLAIATCLSLACFGFWTTRRCPPVVS